MIFNLFKSKPTLRELIPKGFVDIHSHILPGIDDGAKNIEESLVLISEMKKIGFSKIIATPHTYEGLYNNSNKIISNSYKNLLANLNSEIKINYASEYMLDSSLIRKSNQKTLLTIKNNYVLVEMSYISAPLNLYEIIFNLKLNGYIPILAHPERYRFLFNNLNEYKKLINHGCLFQINLLSITGYYGKDILKISDYLLSKGYVNFFGSDIHRYHHVENFNKKILSKRIMEIEKILENNKLFE